MPAKCGCSGNSCSCQILPGSGVRVSGTGTARNPFVVSAGPQVESIQHDAEGALDLSMYPGDTMVTVAMTQAATSVSLPENPATRLEILASGNKSIVWPASIRWVGGSVPATAATGKALWVMLRGTGDGFWVGTSMGQV